ncbi:probable DNA-binding protein containing LysTr domain [Hahella chejuensis KCTC 2396]|uniref:Probable DNA-binding protein containing LysTr domain n=1 Tax=Hahella chejuensis (strain KCTC 2396) TaxID=349521 RepID=Q2SGX7_HAHCH|nr:LytTR family DNA-binding domain-containing protein [Hahella chejuensis]ABC30097.1 probable DNA-binding protein containing LysTr domain [Hahella chejuensis KCTC 2396]
MTKSIATGGLSAVESHYIRSLHEQAQRNFRQSKELIADAYLFDAVNRLEKNLNAIVFVQSAPPYCTVYDNCGRKDGFDVRANLSSLGMYFDDSHLIQIHRSYMINPLFAESVARHERDYQLVLKDASGKEITLPVARARVKVLRQKLAHLFT